MKYFFYFTLVCLITSCSVPTYNTFTKHKNGKEPVFDEISTAKVDSSVYSEYNYTYTPRVRLTETLDSNGMYFPATSKLISIKENDQIIYQSVSQNVGAYLTDLDNDGKIDHYKTRENILKDWKKLDQTVDYKEAENTRQRSANGYEYKLIYKGKDGDSARFLYEEYVSNFFQPKSTEKIVHNLNGNNSIIEHKGAKIEILNATSNSVKYRVIEGFEK